MPIEKTYRYSGSSSTPADLPLSISESELCNCGRNKQLEVMSEWFLSRYEDPAERTSYESREGGYIWIWGGPYHPREELDKEFSSTVPEDVIDELVEQLGGDYAEWGGIPREDNEGDVDSYLYSAVSSNSKPHYTFMKNLNSIKLLLDSSYSLNISVEIEAEQILLRSLYAYVITALETFLSDTFINAVLANPKFFRRFIETNKDFKKEKFSLSTIFEKLDKLDKEVKEYLFKILWHNLKKIENIYKLTLEISFPDEYKNLLRAVDTRHDIVHRSGRKRNGEKVELSSKIVRQLMNDACIFVDHIDSQYKAQQLELDLKIEGIKLLK